MTTLVLVRHGRSTSNTAGTLAGRTPGIELDERGRSQAMAVGERLRGVRLDLAVRSPMLRCEQTLSLALESAAMQPLVMVDEQASECDYGDWSNRALSELAEEPLWATVQAHPSQVVFPGGESMTAMAERMSGVVERGNARAAELAPEGADPTWLLVSHGDPIKAVISQALGQDFDAFQRIMVDPASITLVYYPSGDGKGAGAPMVIAMNTTEGQVTRRLPQAPAGHGPQLGGGTGSEKP